MKSDRKTSRSDLYSTVTDRIVEQLERGVRPWAIPWTCTGAGTGRPLRSNGEPYRGINVLLLWCEAQVKGYQSPVWVTFKQAIDLGAHVRKGEHGSMVVYADRFIRTQTDAQGEAVEEDIPFLKVYTVFNAEQVMGLPARFHPEAVAVSDTRPIEAVEKFVAATGAEIHHGGNQAFYAPGLDRIQVPVMGASATAEAYYATLLHELTHWTRHERRLARDLGRQRFGDAGYAREELVAEIGAAFLCADLAISLKPREDHAQYLAQWLDVLKEDRRAIFQAAAHAQRAAEYLNRLAAASKFIP